MNTDPPTSVLFDCPRSAKELKFEEAKATIAKAMERLDPAAQRRVALKLRAQYEDELRAHEARRNALTDLIDWMKQPHEIALERNDCSRLHKLKEAGRSRRLVGTGEDKEVEVIENGEIIERFEHTFVVKHDWAGAFANAEGIDDGVKLPYELCSFEFRVGGRTIICACAEASEQGMKFTAFVEAGEFWASMGGHQHIGESELITFLASQIRSICIALDAEVATQTVVRAPHKLNEKRVKAGHIPLPDFRIVDLSRRHRVTSPAASQGGGSRKRLHFRRGHWRHYEESKTWVRWCLVGSPDLGFISKQYSL